MANATSESTPLQAGTPAPNFSLPSTPDQDVKLSDIDGPVVLIFYPADWSPVCGDELSMFETANQMFEDAGAQLIAISVDGPWCHVAYKSERKFSFPLLSDANPKGAVSKEYGAWSEHEGISERALFVLDKDHNITWSYLSPEGISPGVNKALKAVEELSK